MPYEGLSQQQRIYPIDKERDDAVQIRGTIGVKERHLQA
jgi:hypothetical protein